MSNTAIALNRFGLGARPEEAVPPDPKRWLLGQFDKYDAKPSLIASLPTGATTVAALRDYQMARRDARQEAMPADGKDKPALPAEVVELRRSLRDGYVAQASARIGSALVAPAPFVERLVHFWANHFAISADKLVSLGTGGMLEFEAIRPHVLGRFTDMLLAVERHPAMLLYLDQAQSIGPASPFGSRVAARQVNRKVGLNENLAREILELHTLGVGSGYTQADVTELARAMTGWSIGGLGRGSGAQQGEPGQFGFYAALHEPGARILLGRRYEDGGEGQAREMLLALAAHPATANHIATKLARHFVADEPPKALVDRLTATFLTSGGDLPALYRVLVESPEAWSAGTAKFKAPWDWSISSLRGLGIREPAPRFVAMIGELGQPIWRPGSPAGWGDTGASWAGPDALVRRAETASRLALLAPKADARVLGQALLPGAISPATTQAIARADSGAQALALLLCSPEFQRR